MRAPDDGVTPELRAIGALVSPFGLVSRTRRLPAVEGEPDFHVHLAELGAPSKALTNLGAGTAGEDIGNSDGAGTGLSAERARLVAVAEALERYSVAAWHEEDFVTAAEDRLADECVSPARWPRCSDAELSAPGSRLRPYDPSVPIRWVRAWSLTRSTEVLVPAIAVYLHMPYASDSERFVRGITTGAAVHSDLGKAVLNGLLEIVERDAIALVWLQRLRLPEIVIRPSDLEEEALEHHARVRRSGLDVRLFDATTDFGVPVLYAVQTSDSDPVLSQVVAATCDVSPQAALSKIYRELSSIRVALRGYIGAYAGRAPDPSRVSVVGGAVHNAPLSRRHLFDFLLEGQRGRRALRDLPDLSASRDPLAEAVGLLAARGAEVIVVDITTDEARQAGMRVVKVLVPEAMPVSFVHDERFLATRRLYDAPGAMGHPVAPESGINREHQPFA